MNPALPKETNLDSLRKSGMNKLPAWFRQEVPDNTVLEMKNLLSEFKINTVCQEAKCPNINYCFKHLKLTFMILGDTCMRNCLFCGVRKLETKPLSLDLEEPYRLTETIKKLNLNYVVITSVTRDDLSDGGAGIFAETIELIHMIDRNIRVEVLIPDFKGNIANLRCVLDTNPDVVAHNIETVERLYKHLRPEANYQLSLGILSKIKEIKALLATKSSIMLGLGETEGEVIKTMEDLLNSGCDILTLGQYLAPSINHYAIKEFINIEQFERYREIGLGLGFKSVLSGPLVRSSYKAEELYKEVNSHKQGSVSKELNPEASGLSAH